MLFNTISIKGFDETTPCGIVPRRMATLNKALDKARFLGLAQVPEALLKGGHRRINKTAPGGLAKALNTGAGTASGPLTATKSH